jgi:hypothetical protein
MTTRAGTGRAHGLLDGDGGGGACRRKSTVAGASSCSELLMGGSAECGPWNRCCVCTPRRALTGRRRWLTSAALAAAGLSSPFARVNCRGYGRDTGLSRSAFKRCWSQACLLRSAGHLGAFVAPHVATHVGMNHRIKSSAAAPYSCRCVGRRLPVSP